MLEETKESLSTEFNDLNYDSNCLLFSFLHLTGLDQPIRSIKIEGRRFIASFLNGKDSFGKKEKRSALFHDNKARDIHIEGGRGFSSRFRRNREG